MALSYILQELQHFRLSVMLIFLPFRIKRQNYKKYILVKETVENFGRAFKSVCSKFYPAHSECALVALLISMMKN